MIDVDTSILVRSVLRIAKTKPAGWLEAEHKRVTEVALTGAPTVKSLSFEGGSASGDKEISTAKLLEVLTKALEASEGDSPARGAVLTPRFGKHGIPH